VNGIIGATDLGITLDGPVSKKSSFVLSVRRSYLKFLFDIFNLPFLPVYNDIQFKYKHKIDSKNHITLLWIGAIDDFSLNYDAPQKAKTNAEKEEAEYILNILPVSTQWNYTTGLKFEHFRPQIIINHDIHVIFVQPDMQGFFPRYDIMFYSILNQHLQYSGRHKTIFTAKIDINIYRDIFLETYFEKE
jgi:hypothetical protein